MEGLLTPVSTTYKSKEKERDALVEVVQHTDPSIKPSFHATTPVEALDILKHEPDHQALVSTLRYLVAEKSSFSIVSPSPIASQIAHVLVSDILPNYWSVLSGSSQSSTQKYKKSKHASEQELFLSCLRSVTGLNALLLALKRHVQISKETKKGHGPNVQEVLMNLLQALSALLEGSNTTENIWYGIWDSSESPTQKRAIWNEFLSLIGGGKLLGSAAEAEDIINDLSQKIGERYWVANGDLFNTWLIRNVRNWAANLKKDSANGWKCCSELLGKILRLGKRNAVISDLLSSMVLRDTEKASNFEKLLDGLPVFEQKTVLYSVLQALSKDHLSSPVTSEDKASWWKSDAKTVSGVSGVIKLLLVQSESRKTNLMNWVTSASGAGVGEGIGIRRAVVAVLAEDKSDIETLLEKSLHQFGDQLYIRHTPTIQQEVHAQILLLCAGHVHRKTPFRLTMMMRAGSHLSAVSNRLASSSPRARFLGMIVGEALSSLVDKEDNKMDFKVEEMNTPEARWFKSIVNVVDTVGDIDSLKSKTTSHPPPKIPSSSKPPMTTPLSGSSKIISIEEVDNDEEEQSLESDEDDLIPYAKPDSDAEDSDEDATNIVRNKPTSPVYIRDLITYLRDTDNYDRQKLGLQTAASLIRRKANFGTEVSTHAEELATLLVGIQDKYEIDDFQNLRLQGMIAILMALPSKMGQWYSKTFFDGDYSISQRASVLTTLGIGARELGGFGKEDVALTKTDKLPSTSFPSKALPEKMHNLYFAETAKPQPKQKALPYSAITTLSTTLVKSLTQPIAASALASSNGPSIMNMTPLSTRQITTPRTRPKSTTNNLSTLASSSFFFPLTGRFFIHLRAYGSRSSKNITFDPFLLSLFIKTLALIMDAAGPNTPSLPQMTIEFWDLLLGLQTQATQDISVMESVLFALLVLLELNGDKRGLVEAHGRQLLETQEWAQGIFERLGSAKGVSIMGSVKGGGGTEEDKVRMLAASVLVRVRECVEKYQTLLMGDLASFS